MIFFKTLFISLLQWFPTFLHGSTLLSYLNFCSTPIILVNNKKVFPENLSNDFSSFIPKSWRSLKKSFCLNSCSSFSSESYVQKLQNSISLNNFFSKNLLQHTWRPLATHQLRTTTLLSFLFFFNTLEILQINTHIVYDFYMAT